VAAFQDLGYIVEMSKRRVLTESEGEEPNAEVGTLIAYNRTYADTKRWGTLDGVAHGHNWCSIQLRAGTGPRLVVISAYARSTRQGTREEGKDMLRYAEARKFAGDELLVIGDLNEDMTDAHQRVGWALTALGLARARTPGTTTDKEGVWRPTTRANQSAWSSKGFRDVKAEVLGEIGAAYSDYHCPLVITANIDDEAVLRKKGSLASRTGTLLPAQSSARSSSSFVDRANRDRE
jgi:hypothetical protein